MTDKEQADIGHNGAINAAELRGFIERVENIKSEQSSLSSDLKELWKEIKGAGFETDIVREIIKIRANQEAEKSKLAKVQTYCAALGIQLEMTFEGDA